MTEEEGQKQRADMRTVNVGIRHENDFAVTQLGGIKIILADSATERSNHGTNFFVAKHLVIPRLLHVQDLSFKREDRLEAAIASLLRGAACRFALDQIDLAAVRLTLRAVSQLAGQPTAIERSFAACKIA